MELAEHGPRFAAGKEILLHPASMLCSPARGKRGGRSWTEKEMMGSVGSEGEGLQVVDGGGGGGEDKGKLVGGALGHCKQGGSMDGLPFVIRSIGLSKRSCLSWSPGSTDSR